VPCAKCHRHESDRNSLSGSTIDPLNSHFRQQLEPSGLLSSRGCPSAKHSAVVIFKFPAQSCALALAGWFCDVRFSVPRFPHAIVSETGSHSRRKEGALVVGQGPIDVGMPRAGEPQAPAARRNIRFELACAIAEIREHGVFRLVQALSCAILREPSGQPLVRVVPGFRLLRVVPEARTSRKTCGRKIVASTHADMYTTMERWMQDRDVAYAYQSFCGLRAFLWESQNPAVNG
jgi:hypothetical protein